MTTKPLIPKQPGANLWDAQVTLGFDPAGEGGDMTALLARDADGTWHPITPEQARAYIEQFRHRTLPGCDCVDTSSGRRIWLNAMTDDDALFVAYGFASMEVEAARLGAKRRKPQ